MHHRVEHNGEPSTERVLVMARQRVFAEALVCYLRREGVAASYAPPGTGVGGATQAHELCPTLLVLVVRGDERTLLDSAASRHGLDPNVRVLLLASDRPEADPCLAALDGAASVLTLNVSLRDLLQVIKGACTVSGITDRHSIRRPSRASEMSLVDRLTEREKEVLGELIAGTSGEEIAVNLRISRNTVRTHVQNILTKLGARTRLEAAAVGPQAGLRPAPNRRYQAETAESGSRS